MSESKWTLKVEKWNERDYGCSYCGWRSCEYVPISVKEINKLWDETRAERDYWEKLIELDAISVKDICNVFGWQGRYTWMDGYKYVDKILKDSGYSHRIDRDVYKSGAKFWKISEIKELFEYTGDILAEIEKKIKSVEPKKEYWDGMILSIYFPFLDKKIFLEERRVNRLELRRTQKEAEMNETKTTDMIMDEIFEMRKNKKSSSLARALDSLYEVEED